MSSTFEAEHREVELAIVRVLLSSLPQGCAHARMLVRHEGQHGLDSYPIEIETTPREMVVPPSELFDLVRRSFALFQGRGAPWKQVAYTVLFSQDTEDWKYEINYSR